MKNKHTAGEWITKEGQIYPQETGKTIALIPYFDSEDKEQQANARLIASAPEMLEALQEIIRLSQSSGTEHDIKNIQRIWVIANNSIKNQ